mgnify:CR=1 FL=1
MFFKNIQIVIVLGLSFGFTQKVHYLDTNGYVSEFYLSVPYYHDQERKFKPIEMLEIDYIENEAHFNDSILDGQVIKSEDGGDTWSNPLNVSNTPDETGGICPNGYPKCDPAEEYPHAAQWATDDRVYIQYQMPNWEFNEIGDLTGADFMNRVYIGYAEVDDIASIPEYEYDDGGSGCYAAVGDVTGDGILNVLDIISLVNHILGSAVLDDICAADYTGDGIVNVLDIIGMVNYILGTGLSSADSSEIIPAEKVVINSSLFDSLEFLNEAADTFGSQSLIVSVDIGHNWFKKKILYFL